MNDLARRLDPCIAGLKLTARTRGRLLWLFAGILPAGYMLALWHDSPDIGFALRRAKAHPHAELIAQARELGLDYKKVVADPTAAKGKPVAWCVDSSDGLAGYVGSRQTSQVRWVNGSAELKSSVGVHGWCLKALAVIEGVEPSGVVRLRFVDKL